MSNTKPTMDNVELTAQRMLTAYEVHGKDHAQRVFQALCEQYKLKDWEARIVRDRFQKLLKSKS